MMVRELENDDNVEGERRHKSESLNATESLAIALLVASCHSLNDEMFVTQ